MFGLTTRRAILPLLKGQRLAFVSLSCFAKPPTMRPFSADTTDSDEMVEMSFDEETGVATLTMNRHPVNSLSYSMCQAISEGVEEAEDEPKIKSLVLTSSSPKVFSAGLDIMELHKPDPERLSDFWRSFQQVYLDLYGSRLATIAAIGGHAPAAGCMLALCCDYRIMMADDDRNKATIGLNETKLGIVAPPWLGQQYIDTVGQRQAELGLSLGLLYSPDEALAMGLVDEVVPKDEVLQRSIAEAIKWGKIPSQARYMSKMLVRKNRLDKLQASRQEDVENFCSVILNDKTQMGLNAYLESLKKKP